MLRIFQDVISTPANTMYKAEVEMKTGMGVVKNDENLTVNFPTQEMGSGVSLVDKDPIPTGLNAGRGEMSDYDENFINIETNEPVKTLNFVAELSKFGTDQFDDTGLAVNDMVAVGTNGKWIKSTVPSIYKFVGKYNDNGHELIQIKIADAIASN